MRNNTVLFLFSEFIAFSAGVVSTVKSRCQRAKNFAGIIKFSLSQVCNELDFSFVCKFFRCCR